MDSTVIPQTIKLANILATAFTLGGVNLAMFAERYQREWTSHGATHLLKTASRRIVDRHSAATCSAPTSEDDMVSVMICMVLVTLVVVLEVFNLVAFLGSKRVNIAWQIVKMGTTFYFCFRIGGMTMEDWGRPICEISSTSSSSRLERCGERVLAQYVFGWIATILTLVSGILYSLAAVAIQKFQ